MSHSTKTLARGVTVKSAQEIHLWLGVTARTICRLVRKRQTWRPFFFFFLKYLNVFCFEDISRRDLVHFKRIFSSLWRADYWEITHFPWRWETVQEVFQSVEEWETEIETRRLHLDAMREQREGEDCSEEKRKAGVMLRWLMVFWFESCLIGSVPLSLPASLLPFSLLSLLLPMG